MKLHKKPQSILFVCLGNICRSPAAHGVFLHLLSEQITDSAIKVDSAGTAAYHVGNSPDKRMIQTAKLRGVDLSKLRARAVKQSDFEEFDLILAMDEENFSDLINNCPGEHQHKIKMFLEFYKESDYRSVPDPYYGGQDGFDTVLDLVTQAGENLLKQIKAF